MSRNKLGTMVSVVLGILFVAAASSLPSANAQDRRPTGLTEPPRQQPRVERAPAETAERAARPRPDRDSATPDRAVAPPDRDFARPDPDRPWGHGRYLDRYDYRPYGYPRHGRNRYYYYDYYTYRFGVPRGDDPYDYGVERAYRQGVSDGQDFERFYIQAERELASYQEAMSAGHAAFTAGDYGLAARHFLLAAMLNQGDPASRICAANAHIAVGEYEPAAGLLRRAFDLQPKALYLPMDIRGAYGNREDFAKHVDSLEAAAKAQPENPELWFLLGYCRYFSNNMTQAAQAFSEAAKLQPDDALAAQLSHLARLGATRPAEPPPKQSPRP